ncbi:hypothetical protein ACLOJK_027156 [Asimina triloba]
MGGCRWAIVAGSGEGGGLLAMDRWAIDAGQRWMAARGRRSALDRGDGRRRRICWPSLLARCSLSTGGMLLAGSGSGHGRRMGFGKRTGAAVRLRSKGAGRGDVLRTDGAWVVACDRGA